MQDPLSGIKAAADFVTELMTAREQESAEMEKAGRGPSIESLHADAQKVYRSCLEGFKEGGVTGDKAEKVCALYARDFDRRHPNGMSVSEGSTSDEDQEPEVEKTVSAAVMAADMGSPPSDIALTDTDQRRRKRLGQPA